MQASHTLQGHCCLALLCSGGCHFHGCFAAWSEKTRSLAKHKDAAAWLSGSEQKTRHISEPQQQKDRTSESGKMPVLWRIRDIYWRKGFIKEGHCNIPYCSNAPGLREDSDIQHKSLAEPHGCWACQLSERPFLPRDSSISSVYLWWGGAEPCWNRLRVK